MKTMWVRLAMWAVLSGLALPVWADTAPSGLNLDNAKSNKLTCQGKFLNPVTDICWSCMFPIRLGGKVVLNNNNQEDNQSTPDNWFCACEKPARMGVTVSFWEPTHLVEVTRTPFCMVSLGGISLKGSKSNAAQTDKDFSKTMTAMEMSREMQRFYDPDKQRFFNGEANYCSIKLGGALDGILGGDCCKTKAEPSKLKDFVVQQGTTMAAQHLMSSVASHYTYTTLTGQAANYMATAKLKWSKIS